MTTTTQSASNLAESIGRAVRRYCEERERDDPRTRGDGFSIWVLTTLFGFERDDAVNSLRDGRGDRSIDAIANDGNRLIVLQSKYNSHDWSEVTKFQADLRAIMDGEKRLPAGLRPAAAQIRDAVRENFPIELYYVTTSRFTGDDETKIAALSGHPVIEALDLDGICQRLLERQSERPLTAPSRPVQLRTETEPLRLHDSLIFPVSLLEFARFVREGEQWLFDSNVRQYLSRSKINQGIRSTVEKEPERFWRYNNGVTMVVDAFEVLQDGGLRLIAPQIVNGCQTSLSISRVIDDMDADERRRVVGSVLVRVIKESDDEERRKITQYTNRQNAVRGKDFFALKDFQRALKDRVDSLGYFYEIQTGSFDMLDRASTENLKGDSRFSHFEWSKRDYRIQAIEAAKCHAAAFRGRVAVCYANPGDLAPNGDLYDEIFPSDLPEAPELFLLPFLLMKHAESSLGYGAAKGESWRRRGRYMFVFAAFRLLSEALRLAGRLGADVELKPEHHSLLREVAANKGATESWVDLTERVMDGFFSDSVIEKLVNEDIFAFLKGPVERKESAEILDMKVKRALDSATGKAFTDLLKDKLPA